MDEGEGGYGESGDPSAQFHSNEAISAVADDGFLAEEDDDYEDLYNDVNVGEGFLQSLRKNDDSGARNDVGDDKKLQSGPAVQDPSGASIPGAGGGASGEGTTGVGTGVGESRVSGRVEGFQNQGFEGSNSGVGSSLAIGGGGGIRVQLGQASGKLSEIEERRGNDNGGGGVQGIGLQQPHGGVVGSVGNEGLVRQGQGIGVGVGVGGGGENLNRPGGNGVGNSISVVGSVGIGGGEGGGGVGVGGGGGGGATILFVGDLHWWTTDAELEDELCKYGQVKEVKFFDEKASGKSKGYCQVEFYESFSATACKEGMNGHLFNGRPCVVAFASPFTVKKMGEAQNNRNQPMNQTTTTPGRRGGPADAGPRPGGNTVGTGGNFQGGDGNNRGYGRGNWGRGNNPGMGNRGPVNAMRNRGGGMGGRGMMGNGGNGFGQGMGATPPMMHHQSMMNQGFDPAFGGPMGRMGGYGGFPGGPTPPFSGILPSFPGVGGVGLPGVAPHVNPAFFGRGMPMNGMGMIPASGVDGPNMGMWSDPNMGGWGGEEHGGGGRAGESSYGEEAASDHQYGEVSHDRAGYAMREKDRGSEKDWSGTSERRYKDDRDQGYERDAPREKDIGHDHEWSEKKHRDDREMSREQSRERDRDRGRSRDRDRDRERDRDRGREREKYREDRDRYADHHRYRDREPEHEDEWDRGRSSRTHSKSRLPQEEEHHSRSKDTDYGKRRRLISE